MSGIVVDQPFIKENIGHDHHGADLTGHSLLISKLTVVVSASFSPFVLLRRDGQKYHFSFKAPAPIC